MISKELLCEVLMTRTIQMNPIVESNNIVGYLVYGNQNNISQIRSNHKQINIYELAHKCKEWVDEEGYTLLEFGKCVYLIPDDFDDVELYFDDYKCFSEKTVPEAIFKACQWILESKNAK